MNKQLNSINSNESPNHLYKTQKFVKNAKRTVRKALTSAWIATSTMGPMATTPTATFVPASVNTITAVALTASTIVKAISLWTAASLLTACGGSEDGPDDPIDVKDTTAPTINVSKSEVDITWWKEVHISGNQLYIWNEVVASWSDNKTKNCTILLSLNWKTITSWTTISEEWTLTMKVSDEAWNIKSSDIKLNKTVNQDILWLDNLKNLNMQVDQEINLLNWVTLKNWANLEKVEIEIDWQRIEISDPYHYIPQYPWVCNIIITVKDKNGKNTEYKVENLTIKPLEYKQIILNKINYEEVLPIIWQVEKWDKNRYEHIEQLWVVPIIATIDMMRKYGIWNLSAKEYQNLITNRLHIGILLETPYNFENCEFIWWSNNKESNNEHADINLSILNIFIKHKNKIEIINPKEKSWVDVLLNHIENNPNHIYIFWNSAFWEINNKWYYDKIINSNAYKNIKKLLNSKSLMLFVAWTNISSTSSWTINKIVNWEYEIDNHWVYSLASLSNSDKNTDPNNNICVTIATSSTGEKDITNITTENSRYPEWFHPSSLYSGRGCIQIIDGIKYAPSSWKYTTSDTNFFNVVLGTLCYQVFPSIKNTQELSNMIKSTCLTNDKIKLNKEEENLQLITPKWFFQKNLLPEILEKNIKTWEIIPLTKWDYKLIAFNGPWVEVDIDGNWIPFNKDNEEEIKKHNPSNLDRRINWETSKKQWCEWKNIEYTLTTITDDRKDTGLGYTFKITHLK